MALPYSLPPEKNGGESRTTPGDDQPSQGVVSATAASTPVMRSDRAGHPQSLPAAHYRQFPPVTVTKGGPGFRLRTGLTWLLLITLLVCLFSRMDLDFGLIRQKLPFMLGLRLSPDGFLQGAALTLVITLVSMLLCILLGIITATGRLSASAIAFGCATFYVSLFRGTPLLVQVLIIYLALPQAGIILGAFSSGIIALSLNYGAYLAETIRSGVIGVSSGQKEAAMALGLSRWVILTHVVAPQALRIILPSVGSLFISMLKDSSLVSLMGLWELNFLAQSYGRSTYHYMEMLATAAAIYWLMSIVLELFQQRLERHLGQGFEQYHS